MLFSKFVYGTVIFIISYVVDTDMLIDLGPDIVRYADPVLIFLLILGAALSVASLSLFRKSIVPDTTVTQQASFYFILALALNEMIAVSGLVYFLVFGNIVKSCILIVFSILAQFPLFPRR